MPLKQAGVEVARWKQARAHAAASLRIQGMGSSQAPGLKVLDHLMRKSLSAEFLGESDPASCHPPYLIVDASPLPSPPSPATACRRARGSELLISWRSLETLAAPDAPARAAMRATASVTGDEKV